MSDYNWYLKHSLDEYSGKWVAILNERVVESNGDFGILIKEIKKHFDMTKVSFARIPQKNTALIY